MGVSAAHFAPFSICNIPSPHAGEGVKKVSFVSRAVERARESA